MNADSVIPVGSTVVAGGVAGVSEPAGQKGPQGKRGLPGPVGQRAASLAIPVGTIMPFGGSTVPAGWLVCDGGWHAVANYPSLYGVIGNNFTPGPVSGYFQVPDTRGRALVGAGGLDINPGWAPWNGWKGGARVVVVTTAQIPWHTHQFDINHTHTVGIYNHNHGFNDGWHDHGPHSHNLRTRQPEGGTYGGSGQNHDAFNLAWRAGFCDSRRVPAAWSGGSIQNCGNMGGNTNWVSQQIGNWDWRGTDARGSSWGHNNVQPSLATTYIIKT